MPGIGPKIQVSSIGNHKTFEDIDQRKLCRLVEKYPILYDRDHEHYHKLKLKVSVWDTIGKQCGLTGFAAKMEFSKIRRRFFRSNSRDDLGDNDLFEFSFEEERLSEMNRQSIQPREPLNEGDYILPAAGPFEDIDQMNEFANLPLGEFLAYMARIMEDIPPVRIPQLQRDIIDLIRFYKE